MHDITLGDSKDLDVLLDARVPIIGIETTDEQRVPQLLLNAAEMQRSGPTRSLFFGGKIDSLRLSAEDRTAPA